MHGHTRPCMAIHGHIWPCMAINVHVWPCLAMHGHRWPYMAIHGHAWPYMAIHGIKKSENRQQISKNHKIKISFRCVKLRDNPENQGFTFFAFLPPYLGVSDSLAYFKRRGLKRSIVWYKKFLISCLVARYSAFFVFKSLEIHGNRRWYGSMFKCKVFYVRWSIRDA